MYAIFFYLSLFTLYAVNNFANRDCLIFSPKLNSFLSHSLYANKNSTQLFDVHLKTKSNVWKCIHEKGKKTRTRIQREREKIHFHVKCLNIFATAEGIRWRYLENAFMCTHIHTHTEKQLLASFIWHLHARALLEREEEWVSELVWVSERSGNSENITTFLNSRNS